MASPSGSLLFLIFASAELRARVSLPSTPTNVQMEGVVERVGQQPAEHEPPANLLLRKEGNPSCDGL